jgi:hypothetical protein
MLEKEKPRLIQLFVDKAIAQLQRNLAEEHQDMYRQKRKAEMEENRK